VPRPRAHRPSIGLTTVRQPVEQITDAAIDLVVATIAEPDRPPATRLFRCRVIDRRKLRDLSG
jgi:DNA-binding LacI/PurR family transcriptional regulator